jgi:hypothetical protein
LDKDSNKLIHNKKLLENVNKWKELLSFKDKFNNPKNNNKNLSI